MRQALAKLHPLGLTDNWADKMATSRFWSLNQQVTHEHYLNVVLTSIEPRSRSTGSYDAYEYTVHSHAYTSDDIPSAKFSYNMSPIQVGGFATLSTRSCHCGMGTSAEAA